MRINNHLIVDTLLLDVTYTYHEKPRENNVDLVAKNNLGLKIRRRIFGINLGLNRSLPFL